LASPAEPPLPDGAAAARIAAADLDELSPVELIERMAISLQRRRAKLASAVSETAIASAAPIAMAPPALVETAAPEVSGFAPAEAPPTIAEPVLPAWTAAEIGVEPVLPAETEPAELTWPIVPPPSGLSLPAALRPIDFSEYEDDEDDLASYIPPRTFDMPSAPAQPALDEAADPPVVPASAPVEAADEVADEEEQVPEESYSSLLDIGRPTDQRPQLVRIEEPEAEVDAVEPVVIFPGRSARFDPPPPPVVPQPQLVPAAVEQLVPEAIEQPTATPQLRRFDAPSADAPPANAAVAPSGAASPVLARDPAETERALRSALATLQRMSGAA
jgi:hypothetical protein